jgi:hypothetical protein
MGMGFDYVCLPSVGASGGIIVAWSQDEWVVTHQACRANLFTITIAPTSSLVATWTLSSVYGPVLEELKSAFMDELCDVRAQATGLLLLCGNFNQIYRATDKNNSRLYLRSMWCFCRLLNDSQL